MNRKMMLGALCAALYAPLLPAQEADLAVIEQIKDEANSRSQVMEYAAQLSDVRGARLSGSPAYRKAASWVVDTLQGLGIEDAKLDPWGKFGRSWSYSEISVHMTHPETSVLVAQVMPWTPGTNGKVSGELIYAPLWAEDDESRYWDMEVLAQRIDAYKAQYKGKLKGKIVLLSSAELHKEMNEPLFERYDQAELSDLMKLPKAVPGLSNDWFTAWPDDSEVEERFVEQLATEIEADMENLKLRITSRLHAFLRDEQPAAVFVVSGVGPGGSLYADDYASYDPAHASPPPTAIIMSEQYNRLLRLLRRGVPVSASVNIQAQFHQQNVDGLNVIATLRAKQETTQTVMLGAHLDSWLGGTGAGDNAAGSAVVMEALRILKALDLPLQRNVTLALWDGEEQNYYGSRAYVREHFANPFSMELKPAHKDLFAYFNLDNGAGRIRGIYLEGNEGARAVFEPWLEPLASLGVTTLTPRDTTYTDHRSFDSVGLPGFQFIQDGLDHESHTHHSNVDTYDRLIEEDLIQAATVMATVIYHAANHDEMMPRKALPKALPPRRPLPEILRPRP